MSTHGYERLCVRMCCIFLAFASYVCQCEARVWMYTVNHGLPGSLLENADTPLSATSARISTTRDFFRSRSTFQSLSSSCRTAALCACP